MQRIGIIIPITNIQTSSARFGFYHIELELVEPTDRTGIEYARVHSFNFNQANARTQITKQTGFLVHIRRKINMFVFIYVRSLTISPNIIEHR